MNKSEIKKKLQEIFDDIFINKKILISNQLSADQVEEWDSLNHINIIVAIENEFKIKFNIDEIESMQNVGDTINIIEKKNE